MGASETVLVPPHVFTDSFPTTPSNKNTDILELLMLHLPSPGTILSVLQSGGVRVARVIPQRSDRAMRDYYAILRIARTATNSEIKAAYRQIALAVHPDVNKGNKASVSLHNKTRMRNIPTQSSISPLLRWPMRWQSTRRARRLLRARKLTIPSVQLCLVAAFCVAIGIVDGTKVELSRQAKISTMRDLNLRAVTCRVVEGRAPCYRHALLLNAQQG